MSSISIIACNIPIVLILFLISVSCMFSMSVHVLGASYECLMDQAKWTSCPVDTQIINIMEFHSIKSYPLIGGWIIFNVSTPIRDLVVMENITYATNGKSEQDFADFIAHDFMSLVLDSNGDQATYPLMTDTTYYYKIVSWRPECEAPTGILTNTIYFTNGQRQNVGCLTYMMNWVPPAPAAVSSAGDCRVFSDVDAICPMPISNPLVTTSSNIVIESYPWWLGVWQFRVTQPIYMGTVFENTTLANGKIQLLLQYSWIDYLYFAIDGTKAEFPLLPDIDYGYIYLDYLAGLPNGEIDVHMYLVNESRESIGCAHMPHIQWNPPSLSSNSNTDTRSVAAKE